MKTYMIGFSVSRNGLTSEIKCPCDEEEISHVQDDLDIPYDTDTRVTVIGVDSDIEQLSVLEGQTVDLDFLNLLGRLMDGMDCGEYEQFRIGLYHECFTDGSDRYALGQRAVAQSHPRRGQLQSPKPGRDREREKRCELRDRRSDAHLTGG